MVGAYKSGTMSDPDEHGIDGAVIQQIADNLDSASKLRPNVVLLHAGTNDMNNNLDPDGAPGRLSALIDKIYSQCPDATILVAQIIGSSNRDTMKRIYVYNDAVADMVAQRGSDGQNIALVPLRAALPPDQFTDPLHPNDAGYTSMARVWFEAIAMAAQAGWIKDPVPAGTSGNRVTCPHNPNWLPQGQIANGAGLGANAYPDIVCLDWTV